jgi:hypothetical protein
MSSSGRDEFIVAEALVTALMALEELPEVRLGIWTPQGCCRYIRHQTFRYIYTARCRFIPSGRPFGGPVSRSAEGSGCPPKFAKKRYVLHRQRPLTGLVVYYPRCI